MLSDANMLVTLKVTLTESPGSNEAVVGENVIASASANTVLDVACPLTSTAITAIAVNSSNLAGFRFRRKRFIAVLLNCVSLPFH